MKATAVGRSGVSLLLQLGLGEWIARDREEYVRVAAGLAGDVEALAGVRAGLRGRMRASPLMDGGRFARDFQAVVRQAWRNWCGSGVCG